MPFTLDLFPNTGNIVDMLQRIDSTYKKHYRSVPLHGKKLKHTRHQSDPIVLSHYEQNIHIEHSTWNSGRISFNEENVKNSVNVFPCTRKLKNTLKTFKRALLANRLVETCQS